MFLVFVTIICCGELLFRYCLFVLYASCIWMGISSSMFGKFSFIRLLKYSLCFHYGILLFFSMPIIWTLDLFRVSQSFPLFCPYFFNLPLIFNDWFNSTLSSDPDTVSLVIHSNCEAYTEIFIWTTEFFISFMILGWVSFINSVFFFKIRLYFHILDWFLYFIQILERHVLVFHVNFVSELGLE